RFDEVLVDTAQRLGEPGLELLPLQPGGLGDRCERLSSALELAGELRRGELLLRALALRGGEHELGGALAVAHRLARGCERGPDLAERVLDPGREIGRQVALDRLADVEPDDLALRGPGLAQERRDRVHDRLAPGLL